MFSDLCHPAATANAQEPLLLPCSALGRNSVVIPIAAFAALGATSLFGHDDLVDLRVAGWPAKRSRLLEWYWFFNASIGEFTGHTFMSTVFILSDTGTYTTSSSLCMCQKMPHQKHYKPVQIVELGKSVDTVSIDKSGTLFLDQLQTSSNIQACHPTSLMPIQFLMGLQDGEHCIKGEADGPTLCLHMI